MTRPPAAPVRQGRRGSAVALAVAAIVLLTTGLLALPGDLAPGEQTLFRWGNADGPPEPVVWAVMQLGNLLAVLVVALLALAARRVVLAVQLLVGGVVAYVLAKLLKVLVDRGRPAELLADVDVRGVADAGRGFPSGHAAVACAVAYLVLHAVPPRWRWAVAAAALLVCLARIHVGAHLPLDVVGGAALGVACAAAARLVVRAR